MKSQFVSRTATCRVILFGFVLFVGGCATPAGPIQVYEGSKRPQNEVMTLIVSTSLEVLAVDDKEIDLPYFAGKDYNIELLPGSHTLDVIYKESWGGPTSSAMVVSDVSRFRLNAEAGAMIMLKHDGPEDLATASRFSDMPNIWLFDPDTGQTMQPYATEKHVPALFRAMGATTGSKDAHAVSVPQASSMTLAEDAVMQQDALKRLQFWWKMAGERDRKAFKAWLAKGAPTE